MTGHAYLNTLHYPLFGFGIFSQRIFLGDSEIEDQILVGLFFINVQFMFKKSKSKYSLIKHDSITIFRRVIKKLCD